MRSRLIRRLLASATIISLVPSPAFTRVEILGVVTQARDARILASPVSAGTTVYDGDRLFTEANGALSLRTGAATFFLSGNTRITLRTLSDRVQTAAVNLAAGTLVFATPRAATTEISADEALIRPAAPRAATLGQVTVPDAATLYIFARRGSLEFSYRGESEVIREGESYRVVLDPTADDSAAKPGDANPVTKPARRRKRFLFFLLAAAFLPGVVSKAEEQESPFQP